MSWCEVSPLPWLRPKSGSAYGSGSKSGPFLVPFFILLTIFLSLSSQVREVRLQCSHEKLALYQLNVSTFWSRTNFPKQYPEFRPPAQFSKLLGRSHSSHFKLFELGERASEALKKFAETGSSELLDAPGQGSSEGVLDAFNAPAIGQGVGEAETQFFVDSNHSRVSLAIRVIPSPDWFIGLSLDLCSGNEWIEHILTNVTHLYDAGTDSGYTFTAPNFATLPQETISRITSQEPSHPASSFYYPDKDSLPVIASFTFTKLKEYSSWKTGEELHRTFPIDDVDNNEIGNEIGDPSPEVDGVAGTMTMSVGTQSQSQSQKGKKKRVRRIKGRGSSRGDCRVSEWSEWSDCSALCGVGEQQRNRYIINHPSRNGGATGTGTGSCPPLTDKRLCNSRVDCRDNYFDWKK